jgi:hypothetical protein
MDIKILNDSIDKVRREYEIEQNKRFKFLRRLFCKKEKFFKKVAN